MLVDTHCHIHEASYALPIDNVLSHAKNNDVTAMICVGTNEQSSLEAVQFAAKYQSAFAAIGVHPHDTKDGYGAIASLANAPNVVAVGEIGLDYFYTHSPRNVQIAALEAQLDIAMRHSLPVIFHAREAFDDFWPIFDNFSGVKGVLHSYTDTMQNLEKALSRNLYIGVNGISTFTKQQSQQQMFDAIPLASLLFETDAPFLTPPPFRGKINEPAFVRNVAEYHAHRRHISLEEIAYSSTTNARALFALS